MRVELLQLRLAPVELVHVILELTPPLRTCVLESKARVVLVHLHGEGVVNVLHLRVTLIRQQYGHVLPNGP